MRDQKFSRDSRDSRDRNGYEKSNERGRDGRRGDGRSERGGERWSERSRGSGAGYVKKPYQKRDDKPSAGGASSGSAKRSFFNPSIDLIVSVVVKNQTFENVVKTINSAVDTAFYSKKIIVSVSKKFNSQNTYNKLCNTYKQQGFVEFNFVENCNHKDNIFNLCKGFARYYLLLDAGIEVCKHSAEKMAMYLKENGRDYCGVSPTFYDGEGQIVKSCRRFPNLADLYKKTFKKASYENSHSYLVANMLERGDGGYLKIHSVSNPIMDCIMLNGEFIVKEKPIFNNYCSEFLNRLKLAKKIVKQGKKIVYFPLARAIRHEYTEEGKPSFFECIKFVLSNGISLRYTSSK